MEFTPEPAPSRRSRPTLRRSPVAPPRSGVCARLDALPPVEGLLRARSRLCLQPASLPVAAACLASTLAEGCTIVVEPTGAVRVLDDRTLATLVRAGSLEARAALRLAAPKECVDESDLLAVARALRLEQDLLEADVRALWSLNSLDDELVLQSFDPAAANYLLSEAITSYTEVQLSEARLPRLPRRFAGELLGSVMVEIPPGDTTVWESSVEIGVRLGPGSENRDCERTIVFDRPSATWHLGD